MDDEERSSDFLHHHMEASFPELMEEYIVMDIEWLEDGVGSLRAVARMSGMDRHNCDLLCLFPPFFSNDANNK